MSDMDLVDRLHRGCRGCFEDDVDRTMRAGAAEIVALRADRDRLRAELASERAKVRVLPTVAVPPVTLEEEDPHPDECPHCGGNLRTNEHGVHCPFGGE